MIKSLGLLKELGEKKRAKDGTSTFKPVPLNWAEFASLTQIRSGKGYQKFIPYDYQIEMVKEMDKQVTTVIVKTRQMGLTTLVVSVLVHQCLLTPGCTCLFVSLTQPASSIVAKQAREFIESLGEYCSLTTDAVSTLQFHNGSTIHFRGSGVDSGRGISSVTYLIMDEIGFQPKAEEIIGALAPSQSVLGDFARLILLSTPAGETGAFYNRLVSNNSIDLLQHIELMKKDEVPPTFFHRDKDNVLKAVLSYRCHPIYSQDENYLQTVGKRYSLSAEVVEREYNLSFTASDVSVFTADLVRSAFTGELNKSYLKENDYYITVDPAGLGSDYFVALVIRYDSDGISEVVDFYRAKSKTTEVSVNAVFDLVEKYHVRRAVVESNGIGSPVQQSLDKHKTCTFEPITTSQSSKLANIQYISMLLETGKLIMPKSPTFVNEYLSFSRIGDKLAASGKANDDLVLATSFWAYIHQDIQPVTRYNPGSHTGVLKRLSEY